MWPISFLHLVAKGLLETIWINMPTLGTRGAQEEVVVPRTEVVLSTWKPHLHNWYVSVVCIHRCLSYQIYYLSGLNLSSGIRNRTSDISWQTILMHLLTMSRWNMQQKLGKVCQFYQHAKNIRLIHRCIFCVIRDMSFISIWIYLFPLKSAFTSPVAIFAENWLCHSPVLYYISRPNSWALGEMSWNIVH